MTNHIFYQLTETTAHCEGHTYKSYGIAAYEGAHQVARFDGVDTDRRRVAALVADCNRLRISLIHLPEILADFFVR